MMGLAFLGFGIGLLLKHASGAKMTEDWRSKIANTPNGPALSTSRIVGKEVAESWQTLLYQARKRSGRPLLTLSTYALARVVASELGSGSPTEMACIADADVNRANDAGKDLAGFVTGMKYKFGRQGGIRPVATSQDPSLRHLVVAELVMEGAANGVALGARRYFDPVVQNSLARKSTATAPAMVVLERWTYNKPWKRDADGKRIGFELGPASKSGNEEWVGPIPGVRAERLMLMRPKTTNAAQAAAYAAARRVIEKL